VKKGAKDEMEGGREAGRKNPGEFKGKREQLEEGPKGFGAAKKGGKTGRGRRYAKTGGSIGDFNLKKERGKKPC